MKYSVFSVVMLCFTAPWISAQGTVNITFELNPSKLNGNIDTSGLFVAGGAGMGLPGDHPLTDFDGDGIYSIVVNKPIGFSSHYTFLNGNCSNWSCKENIAGLSCSDPNNWNDRWLPPVYSDTIIKACFNTCDSDGSCSTILDSVNITFELNTQTITPHPTGIYIAGGGKFGSPGDYQLVDPEFDGIYTITVKRPKGFSSFYTFTNGHCPTWFCKEDLSGYPCSHPPYNDRFLPAIYSDTTIKACFGTCDSDGTCASLLPPINMIFNIDMNSAPDSIRYTYNQVYVSGSFNGWSGNENPLTDNGDGTWTGIVPVPGNLDSIDFKFQVDNWSNQEQFVQGLPCTIEALPYINRFVSTDNPSLPFYCWSDCSTCVTSNVTGLRVDESLFTIQPTLVQNFANIQFSQNNSQENQIFVTNAIGQIVFYTTLNNQDNYQLQTLEFINGLYFFTVQSDKIILTKKFIVSR